MHLDQPGQPGVGAVRLAGKSLTPQQHVCAFFQTREQEYQTLLPFVVEGFERGEKAIHVVDPALRADHLARLASVGIDVAEAQRHRRLDVLDWTQTYLRERPFNRQATATLFDDMLRQARADGFPRCRVIGHCEWGLPDPDGVLIEYEARMNEVLPAYDDPVICAYDRRRVTAGTMMDLFRAHPTAVIDGAVVDNPCYLPSARFVARLRGRPITLLRDRFLAALVAGAPREALDILVEEAAGEDLPAPKLYLEVVQPSLYEVGRLWQEKLLREIHVHMAVDIARTAIAQLRSLLPGGSPNGHSAVVACVEGELHDVGGRMVADFLEMSGFQVSFLGANVATATLEQLVRERPPRLLALSATRTASLVALQRAVAAVRRLAGEQTLIAVGGQALRERPTTVRRLGAHLYARDAGAAAAAACRLLGG